MIKLPFARIEQLDERIFVLEEMESNIFLIKGDEKVLVWDTAYGLTDLKAVVKELWGDLPVICVNSHEHFDHNNGNSQFEVAYVGRFGEPASRKEMTAESKQALYGGISSRLQGMPFEYEAWNPGQANHIEPVKEGDFFDLGGICLKVIEIPGHTAGSIALYEENKRWLFTGDVVLTWEVWGQLSSSLALRCYLDSLDKLASYEEKVDYVFPSHSGSGEPGEIERFMLTPKILSIYAEGTRKIVTGETEGRPYEEKNPSFPGCRYVDFEIGGMAFDPRRV